MIDDYDEFRRNILNTEALLPYIMEELSRRDDSQFLSMERELRKVQVDRVDESSTRKDKLCSALGDLLVNNIRCRLDRIYLESMLVSQHSDTVSNQDDDLEAGLESELQTLADEIVPVVEMFVEHDYVAPLKAAATKRCSLHETEVRIILDKVCGLSHSLSQLIVAGLKFYHANAQHGRTTQNEASQIFFADRRSYILDKAIGRCRRP